MSDKRAFEALEIADALDRIAREIADAGINGFGNAVMAEAERLRTLAAGREGQPVAWLRKNGFRFLEHVEPTDYDTEIPLFTHPAPKADAAADLDVDALAQFIRIIDGDHSMGAGALAESICGFVSGFLAQRQRQIAASPARVGEGEIRETVKSAYIRISRILTRPTPPEWKDELRALASDLAEAMALIGAALSREAQ